MWMMSLYPHINQKSDYDMMKAKNIVRYVCYFIVRKVSCSLCEVQRHCLLCINC